MKFDMHVHSNISPCSNMSIDQILDQAGRVGLDGVCITDHDTMRLGESVSEGIQANGVCLIIGMEYSTPQGDFLIFGPFQDLPTGFSADTMLEIVEAKKGAAIAAHPFRKKRPADTMLMEQRLCGIAEGYNGRNSIEENLRADTLTSFGTLLTAGSDAHRICEIGEATTTFRKRCLSSHDIIRCLHKGLFEISPDCPSFITHSRFAA